MKGSLRFCFEQYSRIIFNGFSWFIARFAMPHSALPEKVSSVLHVSHISHKPYMLSRWLRKVGIRSDYLAIGAEHGWLKGDDKGYDYNIRNSRWALALQPWAALYFVWRIMSRYDVIHIHFNSLLTYDGQDIRYLKEMGKIIVLHFRGCDLRQKSVNNRVNPDLNCCQECNYPPGSCENDLQMRRIALARKYADCLFVTTPDLLDFMPEAEHIPFIAPDRNMLEAIEFVKRDPEIFRIVTCSNHDGIDGTKYIRNAVKMLVNEGEKVELIEVAKTPFRQALAIYKSADLFVSRLRMGYYNNANIETMLMGVPNMSYIRSQFLEQITDCPIIVTTPDTVYKNLKIFLHQRDALRVIGAKGPGFVQKYHDPVRIMHHMINRYNGALNKRHINESESKESMKK